MLSKKQIEAEQAKGNPHYQPGRVPNTLPLYGGLVHAADYQRLKRIADLLWATSPSSVSERKAKAAAVQAAVRVLAEYRNAMERA